MLPIYNITIKMNMKQLYIIKKWFQMQLLQMSEETIKKNFTNRWCLKLQ